ncbi:Hypothetical predicted protein, partial [Mytilus galloprovincialis]
MARDYRQNRRLRKTIRKVIAFGYLPMALVRQNFRLLLTARRTRRLQNRYPELFDFLTYFNRNYLNGNFTPMMLNVYQRNMDARTNNNVESFHRQWNTSVAVRHPSLWMFIRCMKDQQGSIDAAHRGDNHPKRRIKWM